jgi:putative hemin transport protein
MEPKLLPADIRTARAEHSNMRERDLAAHLGIPEAALVASEVGLAATRIDPSPAGLLGHVKALGEVMVLTRNESAVHEKIGLFEDLHPGKQVSMTLGENIDLRIFGSHWAHGFAVEREVKGETKRSLQFFDAAGQAVFKLHLRPNSNVDAFQALVEALRVEEQSQVFEAKPSERIEEPLVPEDAVDRVLLRERWGAMTDPHQFFGMLKALKIARRTAVRQVGDDFAWSLERDALPMLLDRAAKENIEIMCFVANEGCVQIHTGRVSNIQRMGPWINVMDPTFHLHLRQDHVSEVWAVRKPADKGHVTSVEAYDAEGNMIIQFFGKRKEGLDELEAWRNLAETLPRLGRIAA